jgi:hypothetical protein
MKALILALAMVESSFNPSAVGDNGDAVGLLQIHECVIQDVNRVYGTSYTLDDRLNPQASVAICTQVHSPLGAALHQVDRTATYTRGLCQDLEWWCLRMAQAGCSR